MESQSKLTDEWNKKKFPIKDGLPIFKEIKESKINSVVNNCEIQTTVQ